MSAGSALKKMDTLFPRLEMAKKSPQPKKKSSGKKKQVESSEDLIDFEAFQRLDLRVAEVVAATAIKKSKKLLKLTVHAPEERTVVAGIAEFYAPEELVGRQVLIVANLKPAKLMGVHSQGMVLVAKTLIDGKERMVLTTVDEGVVPGSTIA
jgi:methionyl-tRNA synthetase